MVNLFMQKNPSYAQNERKFNDMIRSVLLKDDFWKAVKTHLLNPGYGPTGHKLALLLAGGIVSLFLVVLIIVFTWGELDVYSGGLLAFIILLNASMFLTSVMKVMYWYCKDPQRVFSLADKNDSSFSRKKALWVKIFEELGFSPIVEECEFDFGFIIHDGHRQLSVEVQSGVDVKLFGKHEFPGPAIRFRSSHWKFLTELKQYYVHSFMFVPEAYRFMVLHYGFDVGPLLKGARMGINPETLSVLHDCKVPQERWDEFKDYPAEWVVTVV